MAVAAVVVVVVVLVGVVVVVGMVVVVGVVFLTLLTTAFLLCSVSLNSLSPGRLRDLSRKRDMFVQKDVYHTLLMWSTIGIDIVKYR